MSNPSLLQEIRCNFALVSCCEFVLIDLTRASRELFILCMVAQTVFRASGPWGGAVHHDREQGGSVLPWREVTG
ncbi:hypothetical protein E2C01_072803 [Portunus trituberculatus]|uniref:Uncharacterized protein n=1 Tax=Portunus trituberculatus TaxID=210409 RepID=A0A5B7I8V9_PORTR|nr:hypothetical protein [Portunus trituberculatus]